uniref:Uncharacterized protein n=1 Tax=Oryza barthii TaxID=65489 RepID=A0A0D3F2F1_9ORYZ
METSDGRRSRTNKLAGATFSLSVRCRRRAEVGLQEKRAMGEHGDGRNRTVVTSLSLATHACSCVAVADTLLHGVVGRCRRCRVAPHVRAALLGLEHSGVVRVWTTTTSRRTCGAWPKERLRNKN